MRKKITKHETELMIQSQQSELTICMARINANMKRSQNAFEAASKHDKKTLVLLCKQNDITVTQAKKLIANVKTSELTLKQLCELA